MSNSTRKIKVVFPDGSFAIIDSTDLKSALLSGAKVVKKKVTQPMSDTEFDRLFNNHLKDNQV